MTKAMTADRPDRRACGFVDNASALPTTPQAPPHQQGRTFDVSYKADIFTRYGHPAPAVDFMCAATEAGNAGWRSSMAVLTISTCECEGRADLLREIGPDGRFMISLPHRQASRRCQTYGPDIIRQQPQACVGDVAVRLAQNNFFAVSKRQPLGADRG